MNELIKTTQLYTTQSVDENKEKLPNISVVTLNHQDGISLAENIDHPFEPFSEEMKTYAGFQPMSFSETVLKQVADEFLGQTKVGNPTDIVLFVDTDIEGYMPVPIEDLFAVVQKQIQDETPQPSRQEWNDFYKLQTKETETIESPEFQKELDFGRVDDSNLGELIEKIVFLVPLRIGKKNVKGGKLDFFLLNKRDEANKNFLPLFTDWQHLATWYFSPSGDGFRKSKDIEIAAMPAEDIVELASNVEDISAFVVNATTNDFVIGIKE